MWQLFALGSLVATAYSEVVDKAGIVSHRRIDPVVATFWRVLLFAIVTLVVGMIGIDGPLSISFSLPFIALGIFSALSSLFYTRILRGVEVLEIGALLYAAPFVYLWIDSNILHTSFDAAEIAGIMLLVLGGLAFTLDTRMHRFKKNLSLPIVGMLLTVVLFSGVEAYLFKYLHAHDGISSVNFIASYAIIAVIPFLLVLLFTGRMRETLTPRARSYIPYALSGKVFDATSSLLWVQALTIAAVSQVSAMEALSPLVLFFVTVIGQDLFKLKFGEKLDRSRLTWKAGAVTLLVLGGLLVS